MPVLETWQRLEILSKLLRKIAETVQTVRHASSWTDNRTKSIPRALGTFVTPPGPKLFFVLLSFLKVPQRAQRGFKTIVSTEGPMGKLHWLTPCKPAYRFCTYAYVFARSLRQCLRTSC